MQGVPAEIAERADRRGRRTHRPGRKPYLEWGLCRNGDIIERVIAWPKNSRRVANRAAKPAVRHAGWSSIALIARASAVLADITWSGSTRPSTLGGGPTSGSTTARSAARPTPTHPGSPDRAARTRPTEPPETLEHFGRLRALA